MSKRNPQLYLRDILISIQNIQKYTDGIDFNDFTNDQKTIDAVVRNLEIIGQAARNIPQEVSSKYPDIAWKEMVSMRNIILHEYFGIDLEILWETIKEDIPYLKQQIEKLSELK